MNGAGKTTQLQIVMGRLQPDGGEVIKAKRNMKIAYLAQVGYAADNAASCYGVLVKKSEIYRLPKPVDRSNF